MVLVMSTEEANDKMFAEDSSMPVVSMTFLERPQAIEFLKRIFYIERKTELVKGVNLETHKVIDMWERMNFVDKEAFQISRGLSKRRKLIDIANDMEKRMAMKAINSDDKRQVGIDTTLCSLTVLTQMVRSGEKLLNDLIIFLSVLPHGLGLTEVKVVLKQLPSELPDDKKAKTIRLYLELFREAATKTQAESTYESTSDTSNENVDRDRVENLKDVINSLLYFENIEDPYTESVVKISDNERPALEFIVRSNTQRSQQIANVCSTRLLKHVLDFYLPYYKFLLYKIRDLKSTGYEDHKFISASMLLGMWQSMQSQPDFDQYSEMAPNIECRFHVNRNNVFHLLKSETVDQLSPNLFVDQSDNAEITDEQRSEKKQVIDDLRELSLVMPAALARMMQFPVAIVFINQSRQLFNFEELSWLHGVLNLFHANAIIHLAAQDNQFNNMSYFHELKEQAYQTFFVLGDLEGQAEAHFLWALLLTMDPNNKLKGYKTSPSSPSNFEQRAKRASDGNGNGGSITSEGMDSQLFKMIAGGNRVSDDPNLGKPEMLMGNMNPTALECLEESLALFKMAEFTQSKVCHFNIAKCQYEKVICLMEFNGVDAEFGPVTKNAYYASRKQEILDCMQEVKQRVKSVEKMNSQMKKPVQINRSYIRKFYSRCNLLKAKLYFFLGDEPEALSFIQVALQHLQDQDMALRHKGQKRMTSLQSRQSNLESESSAITMTSLTQVSESDTDSKLPTDNSLIQTLINLKNLILQRMRMNANNLMTFAKATPLVFITRNSAIAVSDATRSDFDMRWRIQSKLHDTGKQFKVKFDILTNRFLKDIAKNGTRLLHLTSDIELKDKLCVEGRYGICNEIPLKRLESTLKQISPFGLQVDVVGLALPRSVQVAQVFKALKVKHVLCFDEVHEGGTLSDQYDLEEKQTLVRFQFNFMYNFCLQFYEALSSESTIIDAFRRAQEWVDNDLNQFTEIWQCQELPFKMEDLNIKAVLLDEASEVHNQKLFDSSKTSDEDQEKVLKAGQVIDTSRIRGQLLGMTKNRFSYVGNKPLLFEVIKKLSGRSNPCPLVHIRGMEHVGRTRFVQEVCYYFYCHNEFRYIIMVKDLSKIETPKEFKDLMDTLNQQIESRQKHEGTAASEIGEDSDREDAKDDPGVPRVERDMLWAFTNADKMKKDFWSRLESRLLDIYQDHKGIRYILTSSADSRKFNFTCFHKDEDLDRIQEDQRMQSAFRRTQTDLHSFARAKSKYERRHDCKLMPLVDHEAVDLCLYHTHRIITHEDFNSEHELSRSIKQQMTLEKVITDCKGLPYLLLQVAELLSKNCPLWKIVVEKKDDFLKGTQAHHKAKRKEMVVYMRKDKSESRSSRMPASHESEGNASGQKGSRGAGNKSKEKTVKQSKNARKKDARGQNQLSHTSSQFMRDDSPNDSFPQPFDFTQYSKSHVLIPKGQNRDRASFQAADSHGARAYHSRLGQAGSISFGPSEESKLTHAQSHHPHFTKQQSEMIAEPASFCGHDGDDLEDLVDSDCDNDLRNESFGVPRQAQQDPGVGQINERSASATFKADTASETGANEETKSTKSSKVVIKVMLGGSQASNTSRRGSTTPLQSQDPCQAFAQAQSLTGTSPGAQDSIGPPEETKQDSQHKLPSVQVKRQGSLVGRDDQSAPMKGDANDHSRKLKDFEVNDLEDFPQSDSGSDHGGFDDGDYWRTQSAEGLGSGLGLLIDQPQMRPTASVQISGADPEADKRLPITKPPQQPHLQTNRNRSSSGSNSSGPHKNKKTGAVKKKKRQSKADKYNKRTKKMYFTNLSKIQEERKDSTDSNEDSSGQKTPTASKSPARPQQPQRKPGKGGKNKKLDNWEDELDRKFDQGFNQGKPMGAAESGGANDDDQGEDLRHYF